MKIGGGLIFWAAITALFVQWYAAEGGEGEATA
jgi:hypothetical protein